ncbi:MAG: hypothetical protein DWQ10_18000 [Calditrichaeota bacterium]|nr:MAG: hypothetical protein DWQ10_18000 [Calditrichota bacterium]
MSLPLGSIRLTRKFLHSDPVEPFEVANATGTIKKELERLPRFKSANMGLLGVAATPITLALMHLQEDKDNFSSTAGYVLTREAVSEICTNLQPMPVAERKKLPGLHPDRADVIFPGCLIIQKFMEHAEFDRLHISLGGLRFGYALAKLQWKA